MDQSQLHAPLMILHPATVYMYYTLISSLSTTGGTSDNGQTLRDRDDLSENDTCLLLLFDLRGRDDLSKRDKIVVPIVSLTV